MAAECFPDRTAVANYSYSDIYKAAQVAAATFLKSNCKYVSVSDESSPAVPIAPF